MVGEEDIIPKWRGSVLAKIATDLDRALTHRALHGSSGRATGRVLARGDSWAVEDVICTSGPSDRPFEEQHAGTSIAIVAAGTFQYRSATGRALMTPGSLLLGSEGQRFECGHEHGNGDRCIAFRYAPEYFERIAADAGTRGVSRPFATPRIPPLRDAAGIVAQACAGVVGSTNIAWEELAVRLAAYVARVVRTRAPTPNDADAGTLARVTRTLRTIERELAGDLTLNGLAKLAGLSPYHFLRTFERLTGLTPHQYVRRARLREAAMRLVGERTKVIDIAFESGFGDVSNFNRAFRTEFSSSPSAHRDGNSNHRKTVLFSR